MTLMEGLESLELTGSLLGLKSPEAAIPPLVPMLCFGV